MHLHYPFATVWLLNKKRPVLNRKLGSHPSGARWRFCRQLEGCLSLVHLFLFPENDGAGSTGKLKQHIPAQGVALYVVHTPQHTEEMRFACTMYALHGVIALGCMYRKCSQVLNESPADTGSWNGNCLHLCVYTSKAATQRTLPCIHWRQGNENIKRAKKNAPNKDVKASFNTRKAIPRK